MADTGPVTSSTAVEGGRRSPGMFLLLTFGWSWTWWAVVALTGVPVSRSPAYLFMVGRRWIESTTFGLKARFGSLFDLDISAKVAL